MSKGNPKDSPIIQNTPRRISSDCNYFPHKGYVWNQDAFKST
ncbi:hypothetical protein RO3G_10652 [Rhizopus delemar RA 99-880]|uniref:Uncharacterized protein n=1 Tax=Rhizopus delemar (strain RA 99-880 / ATCC MYA-4621 / FGSC 9543 / NRRL 43880) TaxID=246409 RepID=I1CBW2_RHIO9|nr:hypothetical protein RO3G_10652 [Rhizopus delemar RA 99-880]|eukprot:EIE85942.1 hypothetical protein RO3G_10652 [Rhizopus delemar RA 99-880]